jgi:hypothetical protein
MLSMQLFRVILDERERAIQDDLRVRRLLQDAAGPEAESTVPEQPAARYRSSWRARTPRASATTR